MRRAIKLLISISFLSIAVCLVTSLLPFAAAQMQVDFKRDIEPILAASCYQCHAAKKAAGQLRLDSKAAAMKGGISGPGIVPGNSKQSRLLARILGEGGEKQMPLGGDPLKAEQIELIRQWIDQGSAWPDSESTISTKEGPQSAIPRHWAYVKPVRPALPPVKTQSWVRNPIDQFVLARLEKEGLTPAAAASKETMLRRVYLDLIGLPPTVKEIDGFLADKSPDAYEKIVDRLLSSPQYGERWARPWLDLARYADSNGYEKDSLRVMWKYRDWVINALNADMPFDQFTIEQIAGDMLSQPTIDQKIASGFHRNTLLNQEGGTDPEEQHYEVLVDRVNTTASVWLGSTLGCAQCHNHKYDPFPQRDYYRMYAIFDNADYQIRGAAKFERQIWEPQLELPTPEQEMKRKAINDEIAKLETTLKTQTSALDAAQSRWEEQLRAEPENWTALAPKTYSSVGGTTLTKQPDNSLLASGASPEFDEYVITAEAQPNSSGTISALMVEAMPDKSLPRGGPGRDLYGHFILSTIEATANGKPLKFTNGNWDDGLTRLDAKTFFNYDMTQVGDRPRGWLINAMTDETRMTRLAVFTLDKPLVASIDGKPIELTIKLKFLAGGLCQGLGRLRLSATGSDDPLKITRVAAGLKKVLYTSSAERTEKQRAAMSERFRQLTPLLAKERDRLEELQTSFKNLGIITALIMQEKPGFDRPSNWVRERGNFASKGEKVYAGVPAALSPLPESAPANRLGLAKWLVDESNPLTARVAVNRAWEQFFGRGIVETSEDFGVQGTLPSHPELLDWLAVTFRDGATGRLSDGEKDAGNNQQSKAWSMKSLHRLIATSATYRQDSAFNPQSALNPAGRNPQSDDPYNRLLARGPRFRVEAEMVRDISLTASGFLSRKLGGPSVMPSQPEGIWRNPYSSEKWATAKGEDRYRRGLYTFLRRTSPYPAMMTFDATSRETCTIRRIRTNTPLQSLTLLNDDAAMEMARALAKRMALEVDGDARARIEYGFR
ncbi:MAG: PSD1 and planctomycete cytochrome C domain-containing protein, partial [Acidobacteriota bacterium]|nr:PSD1 and planctomycete cytochrome C domain-containing protein [Acidobacteriota bacterium]